MAIVLSPTANATRLTLRARMLPTVKPPPGFVFIFLETVYISRNYLSEAMARPVQTKPSGSTKELTGRKHLNASLPKQLVFDFNAIAKRHGHGVRDALVEELLRRFLEKVEPDSRSLRVAASNSIAQFPRGAKLSTKEKSEYRQRISEHEAIRIARERAAEILDATSDFVTRRPPKRAESKRARKRRAS